MEEEEDVARLALRVSGGYQQRGYCLQGVHNCCCTLWQLVAARPAHTPPMASRSPVQSCSMLPPGRMAYFCLSALLLPLLPRPAPCSAGRGATAARRPHWGGPRCRPACGRSWSA